jgi:multimeric flavodoxin WrbA
MPHTKRLLITYHSHTRATLQMAQAVARGAACEPSVLVDLRHASQADAPALLAADGYVFASPEMLGTMAGVMKDFFDRCYYGALDQINARPYACVVCAGSDGHGAARQIERIVTGWRLRAIAPPLIVCTQAQTPEAIAAHKTVHADALAQGEALGALMAAGLAMGAF